MTNRTIKYHKLSPYPVAIGFTRNDEDLAQEFNAHSIIHEFKFSQNPATVALGVDENIYQIVVIYPNKLEIIQSDLVHEAVHVAQLLWGYIGEEVRGMEAEAYLIAHIFELMCDYFNKK